MNVLCFGSINFDYIYKVNHFVSSGETIPCTSLDTAAGGKGLNQAVALAKAKAKTYFAGAVGPNSELLIDTLNSNNVNSDYLLVQDKVVTGHAIIQNNLEGNNCIIVYKGSNSIINQDMVDNTLKNFEQGDYLVIQNEINCVNYRLFIKMCGRKSSLFPVKY